MISFGCEVTGDFESAARREWLVTNGLGGWASGTVSGANTRRYHGLFVPALEPPLGRAVLVSKFEERFTLGAEAFALSANEYANGQIDPHGYRWIQTFRLEGAIPTWVYVCGEALLEKRVWMAHGHDLTFVTYTLRRALRPAMLEVIAFVTGRDAHAETRGTTGQPTVTRTAGGAFIHTALAEFHLRANGGTFASAPAWRWGVKHRVETQRGLPDIEDYFAAGTFTTPLAPGETLAFAISLNGADPREWENALGAERARQAGLIAQARAQSEPEWIQQLILAADQFVVKRGAGVTVIAGYHWFGDWGRDTMIALPGLTLATRRYSDAAAILRTFAQFVSEGMLPNRFPDVGEHPEYNTVDATLWYFHAVDCYVTETSDEALARELWPVLEDIIAWHWRGTRYRIGVDEADGLLRAGEPGVQLTWMDVKIGEWVVTPRMGKPVEINALWINALRVMESLADRLGLASAHPYAALAARAAASFEKFWFAEGGYLYDVLDTPNGADATLRPNQLLALALPHGPFATAPNASHARSIVSVCAAHLLTPYGLRSLTPQHPAYGGKFAGDQKTRDAVYHQGTVWGWLIGPFVEAYRFAFGDEAAARSFLSAFEHHLFDDGVGTIAEVFEGTAPFAPRGCMAQAWSVAEVLRVSRDSNWVSLGV